MTNDKKNMEMKNEHEHGRCHLKNKKNNNNNNAWNTKHKNAI